MNAAMKVFARKGFSGSRSAEIAKAAGVSPALVFQQFGSKRGLYQAIVKGKIEESDDALPFREGQEVDDEELFETIGRSVLSSVDGDPTFLRLLLYSALEGSELSVMFVDAKLSRVIEPLTKHIRRQIRRKKFIAVDPKVSALLFLGMIVQFGMARQVWGLKGFEKYGYEKVVSTAVQIFLSGVRRTKAGGHKK